MNITPVEEVDYNYDSSELNLISDYSSNLVIHKGGSTVLTIYDSNSYLNACMRQGNADAKYGFLSGSFGYFAPESTADGTKVHEFTWQYDGLFIFSFGDIGDQKLSTVDAIDVTIEHYKIALYWDDLLNKYTGYNQNAAHMLIADFFDNKKLCMSVNIELPILFIEYIF